MRTLPLLSATLLACAGSAAAADLGVQFHGFASQGYLATTGSDLQGRTTGGGTFNFNEFALNATASPADRVRIGVQIFAGDLGKYGNDDPKIDFAYGSYQVAMPVSWADLSLSAGRVKMGIGLYNDYRDLDVSRTTVFLPMTVYSLGFRDLYVAGNGAEANSTVQAGKAGSFDLSLFFGGQTADHQAGTPLADALSPGLGITLDKLDVKRVVVASVAWNAPLDGLRVKGSFEGVKDVTFGGSSADLTNLGFPTFASVPTFTLDGNLPHFMTYLLGAEYQHGNLTLAAEYSLTMIKLEETLNGLSPIPSTTVITASGRNKAAYLVGTYQLTPKWSAAAGWNWAINDQLATNPVPTLQADLDAAKSNEQRGFLVAVRYDPAPHWLIKAEFERNRGNAVTDTSDPTHLSLYWNLFALKTTFDF